MNLKSKLISLCICSIAVLTFSCSNKDVIWKVSDFGAVGDSLSLNTTQIQKAIDECHLAGGGTVLVSNGIYISGTLFLKDNVKLHIEEGAQIIGSENPMDYQSIDAFTDATGQQRGKCLIGALNAKNIAITGKGKIDGRGQLFQYEAIKNTMKKLGVDESRINDYTLNRPFLLRFVKSSNIELKDINLRQPAAWTCHFYQCSSILVDAISIYSHAHQNNDGIDLDSSNDAIIKNCNIDTGDDAICFKTTSTRACKDINVSNCKLKSDWGTIKFGTESMGDFKNILIENCFIHDTKGGGIKILSVDGANIDSITIKNISMENVDMPIFIRLGERLRTYRNAPKQRIGSINNIEISGVNAIARTSQESRVSPPSGIFITGTPNHKIGKVSLSNININLPGEGTVDHTNKIVAEDVERYPEFSFFGVLPAYGLYIRHAEQINVDSLVVSLENIDERPISYFNDIDAKNIKKLGSKIRIKKVSSVQ